MFYNLKKRLFFMALFSLSSMIILTGCDMPDPIINDTVADSDSYNGYDLNYESDNENELALLREIQAELAELREQNNELRENNDELQQSLEELQGSRDGEPATLPESNLSESNLPPEGTNTDQVSADQTIVVEIRTGETPEPSPSPTPEPTNLVGRWATVSATRNGESIEVPPDQSMDLVFFANGTGSMHIEGIGNMFTWTGGDTGAVGRIVLNFVDGFGHNPNETVTYRITGTQLDLTHTIFDETITTILRKSE